jgi:membrane-bound lytic murein transglycosylase D
MYIQHEIDVKENPFRNSRAIAKVMKSSTETKQFHKPKQNITR